MAVNTQKHMYYRRYQKFNPSKCIFFLVGLLINSQKSPAQISLAFDAAAGASYIHYVPSQEYKSLTQSTIACYSAGGVGDEQVTKKLSLQFGVNFSRKGGNKSIWFNPGDSISLFTNEKFSLGYVNLPVCVTLKTKTDGFNRLVFSIGVMASYLLGGRENISTQGKIDSTTYNNSFGLPVYNKHPFLAMDFGLYLAGGFELKSGLFFKVFYAPGIKDIGSATELDKNRSWGLESGYYFHKAHAKNWQPEEDLIDRGTGADEN